jgi:DNA-binding phage protein
MTDAEIIAVLRQLRFDPANGRGKARVVPLKRIAEQAGVNRALLYRAINEGRLSDSSREALSPVLIMLQSGL